MDQEASWREIQAFFGATTHRSSPSPTLPPARASHWCYSCDRFVRAAEAEADAAVVVCPAYDGRFLEEMDAPTPTPRREPQRWRHRSTPWNPLHSRYSLWGGGASSAYNLQAIELPPYADGREVTATGFQRLLYQLARIERLLDLIEPGRPRDGNPAAASKAAVEAMPTIIIDVRHGGQHDCARVGRRGPGDAVRARVPP